MKKIVSFLLVMLMVVSLCSCGDSSDSLSSTPPASADITKNTRQDSSADSEMSLPSQEPEVSPDNDDEPFLPLELKESAFVMHGDYLYSIAVLYNPNKDYCVEFPTFRTTARDADGLLLGTADQVLSIIYPQQDFAYAGLSFEVDEVPTSVDIEIVPPDDYDVEKVSLTEHPDFIQLAVTNTAVRGDRVLGEIENPNSYSIDNVIVTVIFRDEEGNAVYGDITFPDGIPASGSIPFDMYVDEDLATDSYEVYANIW